MSKRYHQRPSSAAPAPTDTSPVPALVQLAPEQRQAIEARRDALIQRRQAVAEDANRQIAYLSGEIDGLSRLLGEPEQPPKAE